MNRKMTVITVSLIAGLSTTGIQAKDVQAVSKTKSSNTSIMATDLLADSTIMVDANIGVVDCFQVYGSGKQGLEARHELEQQREELSKDIKKDEQKIQQAMIQYKSKATTLSESAREKEEKKLMKMEHNPFEGIKNVTALFNRPNNIYK